MYDGFVERAEAVTRLLSDRRTTFMVVSTLEATPVREAEFFSAELTERQLHLGAIVLNKVLPEYLRDPKTDKLALSMAARADELAQGLTDDPVVAARVLGEVAESFLNFGVVARREAEQQAELRARPTCSSPSPSSTPTSTTWAGCSGWAHRSGGSGTAGAPGPDRLAPVRRRAPTIVAMAPTHRSRSRALRRGAHDRAAGVTWSRWTPRPGRTSPPGG